MHKLKNGEKQIENDTALAAPNWEGRLGIKNTGQDLGTRLRVRKRVLDTCGYGVPIVLLEERIQLALSLFSFILSLFIICAANLVGDHSNCVFVPNMGVSRSGTKSTPAPKSSATTEYSGIKKRSGAPVSSFCRSKPAEPTTYIVTRETIDYHNDRHGGLQDTTVVGIFSSRNDANKAARADLLNEWSIDFFESYEVEEDDGLVIVTAICPEGEEMTVTVQEAPNKMSLGAKKSSKSTTRKVYHVIRKTIDYHHDEHGGIQDTTIVGTFFSRKEANQVARTDLLKDWDRDFFESYEVEQEDGLVQVTAVCPEGEEMTVTVEEGQLHEGSDKKSKEESDEGSDEESDGESDEGSDEGFDEEY